MTAIALWLQAQQLKEIAWLRPGARNVATSVAATPTAGAFRGNCRKASQEKNYG